MANQDTQAGSPAQTGQPIIEWAYEDKSGQVEAYDPTFQDLIEQEYQRTLTQNGGSAAVCSAAPVEARVDAKIWFNNGTREVTIIMIWAVGVTMNNPKLSQVPYQASNHHSGWKVYRFEHDPTKAWTCPQCTFVNNEQMPKCVCNHSKPTQNQLKRPLAAMAEADNTAGETMQTDSAAPQPNLSRYGFVMPQRGIDRILWLGHKWLCSGQCLNENEWQQRGSLKQFLADVLEAAWEYNLQPTRKDGTYNKLLKPLTLSKPKDEPECLVCGDPWQLYGNPDNQVIPYKLITIEGGWNLRPDDWHTGKNEVVVKKICKSCMIRTMTDCKASAPAETMPWPWSPISEVPSQITLLTPSTLMLLYEEDCIKELLRMTKWIVKGTLSRHNLWHECPQCQFSFFLNPRPVNESTDNATSYAYGKSPRVSCPECSHSFVNRWAMDEATRKQHVPVPHIPGEFMMYCGKCRGHIKQPIKGTCNLVKCETCYAYSNWATGECCFFEYKEMYQKARHDGTLWEASNLNKKNGLSPAELEKFINDNTWNVYNPNHQPLSSIPAIKSAQLPPKK